jgi:hypothetical protein
MQIIECTLASAPGQAKDAIGTRYPEIDLVHAPVHDIHGEPTRYRALIPMAKLAFDLRGAAPAFPAAGCMLHSRSETRRCK